MVEVMKLEPVGKDYLWGGTRLREEYGKKIDINTRESMSIRTAKLRCGM